MSTHSDVSEDPEMHSSISEADTTPSQALSARSSCETSNSDRPEGSFPDASRLTFLPAPSTPRILESDSAEPTPNVVKSEDALSTPKDLGPACANSDEVSRTPAPVGSGVTSDDVNPQETKSPSTEVSLTPQSADESVSHDVDKSGES